MSILRKLIHGTTVQRMSTTPALGQIGSDDTLKQVALGDGVTIGGVLMARDDQVVKFTAAQNLSGAQKSQVLANVGATGLAGLRNVIINPLGLVNQRAVSGSVVLAAGAYGHDMFKAGAAGCSYTFSTSNGVTTFNITAGSLQQVIEASAFAGRAGTYFLSWAGSSTARIGTGAYGASGAVSAVCDGSGNVTVEFGTGAMSKPQFELGFLTDFATMTEQMTIDHCLRYCWDVTGPPITGLVYTGLGAIVAFPTKVRMRASPTVSIIVPMDIYDGGGGGTTIVGPGTNYSSPDRIHLVPATSGGPGLSTAGRPVILNVGNPGRLRAEAVL
ncbi:hypothetical protein LAV84_06975 [Rhizobium sp. VS19-DR104.2]|uniref:hypothetical protein n=1 Tax=unclassified Rhizobium TaxID=2613769 RepID=UPI001CC50B2C|nr:MULTISPECIES: hypothetical protein [unclassified Rhizobium]MBZ5760290.1 hypothetical protein [Rhizobium sp. VS19-DR96]MBZ5766866.1 hypothetical protein [Rhizobium sp. VS19-DR129.2]MBZ5773141.1 hypothetical protein [Rhizobium sp. VS19-DRK62.2]MBZ5784125.1 hypothetical protein [Rhizobium sp. VS19-DR121]MBZ5802485.1 hypothetical protein [Rhizobium sp. VS19-DR181]